MARKIYVSFLGTSNYVKFVYQYKIGVGKFWKSSPTRFIQEALAEKDCKDWGKEDRIAIFTTIDAYENNWQDGGHGNSKLEGLESCFINMKKAGKIKEDLPCTPPIEIPDVKDSKDIWELFKIVNDTIKDYDEIYFDITHAYRFIPMFAMSLFNYSQFVNTTKVVSVKYAMLNYSDEQLAEIKNKIKLEDRDVQEVLDLTPLIHLQDWTYATATYLENGNAHSLIKLAKEEGKKDFANALKDVMLDFQTCRSIPIVKGTHFKELVDKLPDFGSDVSKQPFNNLVRQIRKEISGFKHDASSTIDDENVNNGYKAAIWCFNNQLYQQAITILRENIVTDSMINGVISDNKWMNGFKASESNKLEDIKNYLKTKYIKVSFDDNMICQIIQKYDSKEDKKKNKLKSELKRFVISRDLKNQLYATNINDCATLSDVTKRELLCKIDGIFNDESKISVLKNNYSLNEDTIKEINNQKDRLTSNNSTFLVILDHLTIDNMYTYQSILTKDDGSSFIDTKDITEIDKILNAGNDYEKSDRKIAICEELKVLENSIRIPRNDFNHAGFAFGSSTEFPDGWTNEKLIEEIANAFDFLISSKFSNEYYKNCDNPKIPVDDDYKREHPESYIWVDKSGFKRITGKTTS